MSAAVPAAAPAALVEVDLDAGWGIGGKLHGGYLLATMVEAAMRTADTALHPHPVCASAIFCAPPAAGSATVRTQPLRSGRTVASSRVVLEQGGEVCAEVLLTAGRLPGAESESGSGPESGPGPTWVSDAALPPPIAALADCLSSPRPAAGSGRPVAGHMDYVELRLDPATAGWATGSPAGRADIRGWIRLPDYDPLLAAFVLGDAMPPVTFDLGLTGWVPTLQLQVMLRRVPDRDWLQVRQTAVLLEGGLMDEDCTLWDAEGRLTIQARQLTAVRAPAGSAAPTPVVAALASG